MIRQLAFDLPVRESMRPEDFVAAPANALALAAIGAWQGWPGRRMLLVGPAGAGKSHLAAIWAARSGAQTVAAADLPDAHLPDLCASTGVVVEDAQVLPLVPGAEEAMFHLHNLLAASEAGALLVTANAPPRDWGLALPDLMSRMQAMALTRIDLPDDALLSAVLAKLFADRQVAVAPTLIPWLLARMPRSVGAARALVAALDAQALAAGRPITPRLAAQILDTDASE